MGASDKTTSEKLPLEENPTLEKICRTREQVKTRMAAQSATNLLDFVRKGARPKKLQNSQEESANLIRGLLELWHGPFRNVMPNEMKKLS